MEMNPKVQKGALFLIIFLLVIFVPLACYGLFLKLTGPGETSGLDNVNHEFYFDNKLWFYQDDGTLLGTYECKTSHCGYAVNTINDDEYGVNSATVAEDEPIKIINNRFAVLTDTSDTSITEAFIYDIVSGVSYPMAEPFFVLATQNPIEQDGTYPLPEAQMDRFMFKLIMKYPSAQELADIVNLTQVDQKEKAEKVVDGETILHMRKLATSVPIIDDVLNYAMNLVHKTHPEVDKSSEVAKKYIKFGASPRACQALITGAKIRALMNGNYNVSYEDIDVLALPVLRHRIKLTYNAINDNLTVDDVILKLIEETHKGK